MTRSPNKLIPATFTAVPSVATTAEIAVVANLGELDAVGVLIGTEGDVPTELGLDRDALTRAGFTGAAGATLCLPQGSGPLLVAVGTGTGQGPEALRDAASAFTRATARFARIGLRVPTLGAIEVKAAAQALTEGVILARYRFTVLQAKAKDVPLQRVEFRLDGATTGDAEAGIQIGIVMARAGTIARDLCNTPAGHLTATDMAEVAIELGGHFGFNVEVFNKEQIIEMGCGGLLGVNAGSTEEPRIVKLRYAPAGEETGHLGLVGKGIMYDSGGISLKPSDPMHLLMKMDMGGAASVLAAFTAFRALEVNSAVSGWLMCTDNMPSGSAYKLGDVLTTRSGKTIEVKNTDAEGRLVMCDAMTLANEDNVDAIIDIATLTGAALMALGELTAPVFGNDQAIVDRVTAAAATCDEQVWQLPLEKKYRAQLDSDIADISNLGGKYAGATTAALFLADFVGDTPWAHLDIAGTMQSDSDDGWRSKGATGFGARTLIEVARHFRITR
ncbi:leucyl aminopeptidase [Arthrobacter cryoconiti]|uniref:Probable cytosol aminopeptidase n=1 Tax=Arthrobacter cryoconiti TaxID=748907 RepID=A0ABV8R174_9MICC|nr:leucyl aminopeptidase [Arthrobacter cryoconiti]MCC9068590.1 leucyl aminopeptidase [Arthrobacter cryoconiti]